MASLAEIRARLEAQQNKNQNKSGSFQSDNAIYPHWNMPAGSSAQIRFLPDGDSNNDFFWVERNIIKLPFNGVKGDPNSKPVVVQVPCVEMFGENCPILAEVRPWYKDDSLKDMANKYWKKRSYLFQGFVRVNPMAEDVTPNNPIRRFIVSPQLIPIIKDGLMDPQMEELPTHDVRGLDFMISKIQKGKYAEYTTSKWMRKETPLTEAEVAAIETHGLFNLKDFLPKKPSEAELKVIKEMFDASVDGRPYDVDKWGAYYRPFGLEDTSKKDSSAPSSNNQTNTEEFNDPSETDEQVTIPNKTSSDKAADILARIRDRKSSL